MAKEPKASELDALVATYLKHLFDPWPWQFTDEDGVTHNRLPPFSTDDAVACQVLDALAADGWGYTVSRAYYGRNTAVATFWDTSGGWHKSASAPTRAEAICRAALKAVKAKT